LAKSLDETALMWAVRKGNIDAVSMLLDLGADISLSNCDGETALELANDKPEIKNLLENHLVKARS
jgi:ankyrin repeat protein